MSPKNALDHLILFLPADPATNLPKIPKSITQNFTLTPGGTHADGLTSNTLILLSDGCYIELITFVPTAPPSQISAHWWSYFSDRPGWADWCLINSLSPEENHKAIQESHQAPRYGGRKRADGVDVKWAVTFPKGEHGGQTSRGRVPFFCHDVTERNIRVPLTAEKTTHESGILGVHSLTVLVKDDATLENVRSVYATLFGSPTDADLDHVEYEAERVVKVKELERLGGALVSLRLPDDEGEREQVKERGFWYGDIVLAAKARAGKEVGTRERIDGDENDLRGLWVEYV